MQINRKTKVEHPIKLCSVKKVRLKREINVRIIHSNYHIFENCISNVNLNIGRIFMRASNKVAISQKNIILSYHFHHKTCKYFSVYILKTQIENLMIETLN